VRVLTLPKRIKLRAIRLEYRLIENGYNEPIDIELSTLDTSKYAVKTMTLLLMI